MGLPELTFTLKKAAETVSTRISRGAVALILRDAKANGVHVVCQESDIPTTLGADNIAYIKRSGLQHIHCQWSKDGAAHQLWHDSRARHC